VLTCGVMRTVNRGLAKQTQGRGKNSTQTQRKRRTLTSNSNSNRNSRMRFRKKGSEQTTRHTTLNLAQQPSCGRRASCGAAAVIRGRDLDAQVERSGEGLPVKGRTDRGLRASVGANSGAWMGPCCCPALAQSSLVMWIEGGVLLTRATPPPATNIQTSRLVFSEAAAHQSWL
jgi:hypothetical protein